MLNNIHIGIAGLVLFALSCFPVFFAEARTALHLTLLLSIIAAGYQYFHNRSFKIKNNILLISLLFYLLSLIYGYWNHPDKTVLHRIEIAAFALLFTLFIPTQLDKFSDRLYSLSIIFAAFLTAAFLAINYDFHRLPRLSIATNAINIYATAVSFMFILSIQQFSYEKGRIKIALLVAASVFIFALILTQTRGAWLAVLITIFIMVITEKKLRVPTFAIFILLAISLPFNSTVQKRTLSIKNELTAYFVHDRSTSMGQRFDMWINSTIAISEKPITGHGNNNLQQRYASLESDKIKPLRWHPHAHNDLLEAWSSFGIFHFLATALLFIAILLPEKSLPIIKRNIPLFAVYFVTGLSESILIKAYSLQFLVIFALINIHLERVSTDAYRNHR